MTLFLNFAWTFVGVLKFGGLAVALIGVAVFGWYFVRGNARAARDNADKIPSSSCRYCWQWRCLAGCRKRPRPLRAPNRHSMVSGCAKSADYRQPGRTWGRPGWLDHGAIEAGYGALRSLTLRGAPLSWRSTAPCRRRLRRFALLASNAKRPRYAVASGRFAGLILEAA